MQKIVDESVDKLDTNAWSQLKNKTSARDSAVLASEKAAQVARATIGKLILNVSACIQFHIYIYMKERCIYYVLYINISVWPVE